VRGGGLCERADHLTCGDDLARRDGGHDRLHAGTTPVGVRDGDHGPSDDRTGERDDARGRSEDLPRPVEGQVDAAVPGGPALRGWVEGPQHLDRTTDGGAVVDGGGLGGHRGRSLPGRGGAERDGTEQCQAGPAPERLPPHVRQRAAVCCG
jgi:hypothetical protein